MKGHLLCLLPFPEPKAITERIKKQYPELKITYRQFTASVDWTRNEKIQDDLWSDVTILFTLSQFPIDLKLAPKLELVHMCSAGTNHIWNLPIYAETSIPITTSAGVPAPMIAEWAVMNILVASHKYNTLRDWQLQHDAGGNKGLFNTVSSTIGKRIGILGYGAIGRQVAKVTKAMGMEVIAYTATLRDTVESKQYKGFCIPDTGDPSGEIPTQWHAGTDKKSLHDFLNTELDYLLISLPLTKSSEALLGKAEFMILAKKNAFIINVSRGEILVQEDLIEALTIYENGASSTLGQKRLGLSGAALDVTVPEPLPKDHPLWSAPNCIIIPHICGISHEYGSLAFQVLENNLQRLARGLKLLNQVNRETGYTSSH